MFKMKELLLPTTLIVAGFALPANANAEDQPCFTIASIQGTWASVATYGANVAIALSSRTIDATGHFNAPFLLNAPVVGSATGDRTIITGTNVGYYTVNCNGTGTVTRLLTSSNGVPTTQIDDFLITKSIRKEGRLIATAIVDAVRVPSALVPGGIFVDRTLARQSISTGD
jgi:hypothetical protein